MESFEQSYATLPQDLVGNLRPAAREIGFARSLRFSLYLSPSIFSRPLNEIAQSFVSRLLPVSDRVSPRSFICHSVADRFAYLSIFHPSLFHCLTLLSRYSKAGIDSVWRGGARGQSKGNFQFQPLSFLSTPPPFHPTFPRLHGGRSTNPSWRQGDWEYGVRYLDRLGEGFWTAAARLRPAGVGVYQEQPSIIRNPWINHRY